ncbi:FAD-binding domain-containing protein [Massarina eburnea CBS 473.64]|uniref:Delta(24)-sterol reductase n=1 Tax=Massarina eburnea CBS 473.64 TaxID=1395130 RepID=A0A6A6S1R0_9PLEO|nr:FAD-binding domain-containing protein [Massarina eburnea CBS 473.64]
MDTHRSAVATISDRVKHFYSTKTAFRVYHGSTNSTRHADFDPSTIVDVSALNNILSISPSTLTATVEPNVPMHVLVRETTKVGLLPPVVMEFPAITVGGGFIGTAGESSSFKHGFFDRTVVEAEVVLANGDVVNASEKGGHEEKGLFEGLRGSFGTLGVLTCVKMRLVEMRRFVQVSYLPVTSFEHAVQTLQEETKRGEADYVDGVLFAKDSGAIVTGRLTDKTPSSILPLRRFSRPWDEWFWVHAKSLVSKAVMTTELVPVDDYLFRYDRGAFWMGMYAYKHFMVPFTRLTRFLLDYFMHTRIMYHALHASGYTDQYIIQDIALPAPNTEAFVQWVHEKLGLYPLWLCPLRNDGRSSMGHPQEFGGAVGGKVDGVYEGEYINVGVWGPCPSSQTEYLRTNRELEDKVRELGGLKWLYGRVFYTEDEWWQIYDKTTYNSLRQKYNATSLPTIWDKVKDRVEANDAESGLTGLLKRKMKRNGLLSGLYGIYKAVRGGDYILKQKKA